MFDLSLGLVSVVSLAQLKFVANVSEVVGYDGDFWTGLNDQKFEGNEKYMNTAYCISHICYSNKEVANCWYN